MSGRTVLLVESQPGAGLADAAALTDAGDRVVRCFPDRWDNAPRRHPFMCTGVAEGNCPLEHGVDVALVVRGHMSPRPTGLEAGALCALRQGIPMVERGLEDFDPYAPWLDGRVHGDVVRACDNAIAHSWDGLRREIVSRVGPVLADAGVRVEDLDFAFETPGTELRVVVTGPEMDHGFQQRLALRVADVVRAGKRSFSKKTFAYEVRSAG